LENKAFSRVIISFDAKSGLYIGGVYLVHFEADERVPEFFFRTCGGDGCRVAKPGFRQTLCSRAKLSPSYRSALEGVL